MKQKLTNLFISFTALVALCMPVMGLVQPQTVFAANDAKKAVCEGVGLTGGTSDCSDPASGPSVYSTVRLAINILSWIVGIAAVIMIIVGGLKYILSQGEGSNTASAKNTILYALVGLVVVALAQVIVKFVLNKATK